MAEVKEDGVPQGRNSFGGELRRVPKESEPPPWNDAEWLMFGSALDECMFDAHELCKNKGWWTPGQDHIAIKVERVHAELSELCDVFARGTNGEPDKDCPDFTKAEIEWADCMLRLMDLGGRFGFRPEAIRAKFLFNRTRSIRHGGKAF